MTDKQTRKFLEAKTLLSAHLAGVYVPPKKLRKALKRAYKRLTALGQGGGSHDVS